MVDTTEDAGTEAVYAKSTQQLDLEQRLRVERGEIDPDFTPRDFSGGRSVEELDAFVGVDPVYRNYADDTGKAYFADTNSAEGEFETRHVDNSDRIIVGFSPEELDRREENERAVYTQMNRDAGVVEVEPVDNPAPTTSTVPSKGTGKISSKAVDKPKD